jgi:molybdenum cofactor cytidylyltransferase
VVLAAGSARRFGGGKLLAPYRGSPLLHGALTAARAACGDRIIVVTGADALVVEAAVHGFAPSIRVVHAADHAEGMAASLRTGIAALAPDTPGAFVFLGDMPRVPHAVLPALAAAVRDGAPAAAPIFGGRRGNPVLLGAGLFEAAARLTGDQGARPLLQALGARLALVEAPDDGVLFDVDKASDLGR